MAKLHKKQEKKVPRCMCCGSIKITYSQIVNPALFKAFTSFPDLFLPLLKTSEEPGFELPGFLQDDNHTRENRVALGTSSWTVFSGND